MNDLFPWCLRYFRGFSSPGESITKFESLSMFPPYPWGHWFYSRLLFEKCSRLEGDLAEFGVGRGGMSLYLGSLIQNQEKKVWSIDSFEGLPAPDPRFDNPYFLEGDYSGKEGGEAPFERFKKKIADLGLEGQIYPVKSWFKETRETLKDRHFCFVHIDGDLYDSTKDALEVVYDKVVEGGVIVLDEFFHHAQGPSRAAADFFNSRGITPVYHVVYPYSVFLFKGEEADLSRRSLDGHCYDFTWMRGDRTFLRAVEESIFASMKDPESFKSAQQFLAFLRGTDPRPSDVYAYWKILERLWETVNYTPKREVYRI